MKQCPNCHDANSCGDYEGPTCEVCRGFGYVEDDFVDRSDEWGVLCDYSGLCYLTECLVHGCIGADR